MKRNLIFNHLFFTIFIIIFIDSKVEAQVPDTIIKTGTLTADETWSGVIHVINNGVIVPEGITLTIKPGTVCLFQSDRNYQTFNRARLTIDHGTLKAIGKPDSMIWFTSDNPSPVNGDWGCIHIEYSHNSELIYSIIEFGQLGIEHFFSRLTIRNCIIRYNNIEGLYGEHSKSIIEANTFYKNTYHDIAMENFNDTMMINHNKFGPGNQSIVFQQSKGIVSQNYFEGYSGMCIGVTIFSWARIDSNHFDNHLPNPLYVADNSSIDSSGNNCGVWSQYVPVFDYPDTINHSLEYIPGDTNDLYPYVYDQVDETRRFLKRVGKDLHFGWAIGYFDGYLWKLDSKYLFRIDTATGDYTTYNSPLISGPGGLTHDGQYFWAYEKNFRQIFKFEISADSVHVLDYFAAPDSSVNRAQGLTTDGTYLYQKSLTLPVLFKFDKNGNMVDSIDFSGSITIPDSYVVWADGAFWGPCPFNSIGKWSETGQFLGSFYQVAFGTEAMCFDGQYFWTLQKTCELWNDDKIFKIDVLNLINTPSNIAPVKNNEQLINIFPNPAYSKIFIESYLPSNTLISIISIDGKLIYQKTLQTERTLIDIKNLGRGLYIVKAKNKNGIQLIKLIKY